MVRLVAPVTDHLRVAVCPVVIQEGLTAKLAITGACLTGGDDPPPPTQLAATSPMQTTTTARVAACNGWSMEPPLQVRSKDYTPGGFPDLQMPYGTLRRSTSIFPVAAGYARRLQTPSQRSPATR